jgi:hypothetical protein
LSGISVNAGVIDGFLQSAGLDKGSRRKIALVRTCAARPKITLPPNPEYQSGDFSHAVKTASSLHFDAREPLSSVKDEFDFARAVYAKEFDRFYALMSKASAKKPRRISRKNRLGQTR